MKVIHKKQDILFYWILVQYLLCILFTFKAFLCLAKGHGLKEL